jgi:hypothetical protein
MADPCVFPDGKPFSHHHGNAEQMTQLATMKKMHPAKAQIAKRLRKETTMTFASIAQQLYAGSPSTLASAIYQLKE